MPLNDKDDMLIKINEKTNKQKKSNKMQWLEE